MRRYSVIVQLPKRNSMLSNVLRQAGEISAELIEAQTVLGRRVPGLILMDTWMKAEKAKLTTDEHCIDDKGAARKLRHPSRSRKLKAFMDGIREA